MKTLCASDETFVSTALSICCYSVIGKPTADVEFGASPQTMGWTFLGASPTEPARYARASHHVIPYHLASLTHYLHTSLLYPIYFSPYFTFQKKK